MARWLQRRLIWLTGDGEKLVKKYFEDKDNGPTEGEIHQMINNDVLNDEDINPDEDDVDDGDEDDAMEEDANENEEYEQENDSATIYSI